MTQKSALVALLVSLVIFGGEIASTSALQLNLTASCRDTETLFCIISDLNPKYPDTIVVANASQTQLTSLVLRNSLLRRIPSEIFIYASQLQTLIVHNCAIQRLMTNDFDKALQLRKLILQNNRLSDVPDKVFHSVELLEELYLSGNFIHTLHRFAFTGLGRLKHLDLQNNAIESLPLGVFEDLIDLEHIDLSHNRIEKIDGETFAKNKKLKIIMLNDNIFTVFEPNSLEHLPHLRLLDVSNNSIGELSLQSVDTLMAQNAKLERLNISGSVIKIHAGNNRLDSISVGDPLAVHDIELNGNSLETLDSFVDMLNLQRLDVAGNKLKSLQTSQSKIYLPLSSLISLDLASNQLENLTIDNFVLLQKLTHLDLAFNHLHGLDYHVFEPLYNLEKLYLEFNHLETFNYTEFLKTHYNLKELGLSNNYWDSRFLHQMIKYLKDHNIQVPMLPMTETTISDMSFMPTRPTHHGDSHTAESKKRNSDKAGVSGIHPYFTMKDILALAVLIGVAIVIALQFYTILRDEGCLPERCSCFTRCLARVHNMRGRPQRLDEDDSEV